MNVDSLHAHCSPACRAHPGADGPASSEVSAGYSAAFLTLEGVAAAGCCSRTNKLSKIWPAQTQQNRALPAAASALRPGWRASRV